MRNNYQGLSADEPTLSKVPGQTCSSSFSIQSENNSNEELLDLLCHVRPGKNFQPLMDIFEKIQVNGKKEDPLFTFLKKSLPTPHDDPEALIDNPSSIIWKPVKRSDISWNFEKFLVSPDGLPVKRYSKSFLTSEIEKDIEDLLDKKHVD